MKINFKTIKKGLGRTIFFIADNLFLACLLLFLISLIIGLGILGRYTFFSSNEASLNDDSLKLDKADYDNITSLWEQDQKIYTNANSKKYPNPFYFKQSHPASPESNISGN